MSGTDVIRSPLDVPCIAGVPVAASGSLFILPQTIPHISLVLLALFFHPAAGGSASAVLSLGHRFVPEGHRCTSGSLCCGRFLGGSLLSRLRRGLHLLRAAGRTSLNSLCAADKNKTLLAAPFSSALANFLVFYVVPCFKFNTAAGVWLLVLLQER